MAKAKTAAESRKIGIKKKSVGCQGKNKKSFAKQSKNYQKHYVGQGR
jgi:hypothetical protein